ncbi:M20/M25/M40 family metallo-hydrolase [Chitinophaga nivalis]|uniref:Carboxypeptidase Q n=1 Tax=Chitinophaga nivalis TaxID=2991709 RepID=A0ABT3IX91_9BACT|nr:M20/M25/M40 family metallo-hydrolase [Chitinophaga nivalis]MCW3461960.1 M20/M25/M40 family metallo-hydrolase [Chitinophaga nivalis]MCW3488349.1 M20/M25/M40 family metallo-hydrolase [Chitinophaga nivalis]
MKKHLLPILFACSLPAAVTAQQQDSLVLRRIADEVLTHSTAYENLRILTKTIGGRLAGSPQMVKAEQWGVKALQAAGADTVYLQECKVPHWVRGEREEARIISNRRDAVPPLNVLALGNSVGTGKAGITAPVLEVASFEDLEAKKDQVKGKIVFYNYHFKPTFIKTFYSYGDAVKYRGQGASKAARYGAVAVIVRSMSHAADNHPHTGAMGYDPAYPKIPAVAIGLEDADRLSHRVKDDASAKVFLRTNCQMLADTIGHNVIAELRGSKYPDQYLTVGGHLDSWDINEGAHDDGAGCVQSIEVLRAFKAAGIKPTRTLRVVLFANEENGTRGGRKYAEEAKARKEKHIMALESDAGGFTPRGFTTTMDDAKKALLYSWKPLFAPYGIYDFEEEGGGVDVGQLAALLGTPIAELSPDSQRYFDIHHAASDVFESVNKRELELGAFGMAGFIYLTDLYF